MPREPSYFVKRDRFAAARAAQVPRMARSRRHVRGDRCGRRADLCGLWRWTCGAVMHGDFAGFCRECVMPWAGSSFNRDALGSGAARRLPRRAHRCLACARARGRAGRRRAPGRRRPENLVQSGEEAGACGERETSAGLGGAASSARWRFPDEAAWTSSRGCSPVAAGEPAVRAATFAAPLARKIRSPERDADGHATWRKVSLMPAAMPLRSPGTTFSATSAITGSAARHRRRRGGIRSRERSSDGRQRGCYAWKVPRAGHEPVSIRATGGVRGSSRAHHGFDR